MLQIRFLNCSYLSPLSAPCAIYIRPLEARIAKVPAVFILHLKIKNRCDEKVGHLGSKGVFIVNQTTFSYHNGDRI